MGYKPSVFEQVKFDYSLSGNISTKRLDKDDKKEGHLKSEKNIGDVNKELLKVFSAANKVSHVTENESDFNYDTKFAFYRFYRTF